MLLKLVTFSLLDYIIILVFFLLVLLIGFFANTNRNKTSVEFLLSNRNVGLLLFILTNVSTWYGGILGISEFTYRYGISSWTTQGLPYYVFAIIFAIFFSKKIREANIFTIPQKILMVYGKEVAFISSICIFFLINPAPYLFMLGSIIEFLFGISLLPSLIIVSVFSILYLIKGGFRSDLYTDAFEFFIMFIGFGVLFLFSFLKIGDYNYLVNKLPATHLSLTGDNSWITIIVWVLIASWTIADPGFHQRCSATKSPNVAYWGIIISIFFWLLFDILTNSVGLYAKTEFPALNVPSNSFFFLAEKILPSGFKGIFYAGVFATIMSTLNSFFFLSATTYSQDIIIQDNSKSDKKIITDTNIGLVLSGIIATIIAFLIPSVIDIWYTLGSILIPGLIFLVISSYYTAFSIPKKIARFCIISSPLLGIGWYFIKLFILQSTYIEPMLIGIFYNLFIYIFFNFRKKY